MKTKLDILTQYFGYTSFRPGQTELIDMQLSGRDVFGVMPTGGGKSICYQVPALMNEGVTIVVSPLISLMKDQTMALKNAGVPVAYINSSLTPSQIEKVFANTLNLKYKIIYVAPERLLTNGFVNVCRRIKISTVVVDEAHCISQWGQDFRPGYLKIIDFLNTFQKRPVVAAFTATATGIVRDDVVKLLGLNDPFYMITGFDRPNLHFEVLHSKNKKATLYKLLAERKDQSGIIYCATRKKVEALCEELQIAGYPTTRYHAGLSSDERSLNQNDFVYDACTVMVATNAFGMGIDKSNISYVIHYNMPKSIEAYYQEAGRAGRDGTAADCILLYNSGDIRTNQKLIFSSYNEELSEKEQEFVKKENMKRLDKMIEYCKTDKCYRQHLIRYFGQDSADNCGNCGNCNNEFVERDITIQAQMILSSVKRVTDRMGYPMGKTVNVHVLKGGRSGKVHGLGLNSLKTFGIMNNLSKTEIREILDFLLSEGYLLKGKAYETIELSVKADEVLFEGAKVIIKKKKALADIDISKAKRKPSVNKNVDTDLLQLLKNIRAEIADKERVPAYIIFTNATLEDMAIKAPVNIAQFLDVSGVGKVKAEKYSKIFTENIRNYIYGTIDEKLLSETTLSVKAKENPPQNAGKPWSNADDERLAKLFDSGSQIKEIAEIFERTNGSIRARLKKLGKIDY